VRDPGAAAALAAVEAALWRRLTRAAATRRPPDAAGVEALLTLVRRYGDAREAARGAREAVASSPPVAPTGSLLHVTSQAPVATCVARAPGPGEKACSRCGLAAPLAGFFRDASKPDGYRTACKKCELARQARRRRELNATRRRVRGKA
jgi:hypothetical protein